MAYIIISNTDDWYKGTLLKLRLLTYQVFTAIHNSPVLPTHRVLEPVFLL